MLAIIDFTGEIAVGAVCLIGMIMLQRDKFYCRKFLLEGNRTKAKVTKIDKITGGITYQFADDKGQVIIKKLHSKNLPDEFRQLKIEDTFTVIYKSDNSADNCPEAELQFNIIKRALFPFEWVNGMRNSPVTQGEYDHARSYIYSGAWG